MENEELEQVKYDCDMYLRKIKAIKKAKEEMINLAGKPAYDTRVSAIEGWEIDKEVIKKTLIPYLDKLKILLTK